MLFYGIHTYYSWKVTLSELNYVVYSQFVGPSPGRDCREDLLPLSIPIDVLVSLVINKNPGCSWIEYRRRNNSVMWTLGNPVRVRGNELK